VRNTKLESEKFEGAKFENQNTKHKFLKLEILNHNIYSKRQTFYIQCFLELYDYLNN